MDHTPRIAAPVKIDWPLFRKRIATAQRVLLTSHVRPDGDSIGSEIAMYHALQSLGKEVRIINDHPIPPDLRFLDPDNVILRLADLKKSEWKWVDTIDLICLVDTSSWMQLGEMESLFKQSSAQKIVLDHHAIGNDLGADMFVDPTAEATGTLCLQAVKELGLSLTPELAVPIFVAIATDTGWFRFHSVQDSTFQAAAELVEAGVRPDEMYRLLYEQESLARIRLIGRALERTESYLDGTILGSWLTLEDFDEFQALPSDSEDVVNMPLRVAGTQFAFMLVEQRTGGFKASFRSRCDVDCSLLAAMFQGGGHKRAAGATLFCTLEESKRKILDAVLKAFEK
ncbi:MAG: bifunctional oligoribonuclease/PAP phosphatase NrnA [Planctomycetaceae bacterium]|nr:bifunctional oligoribonuclease/PAP phosphatase NrnA [Planctomycetaceae bacterium]